MDFKTGERIELDGIAFVVERRTPSGIQMCGVGDGFPRTVTDEDLVVAFMEGRLRRHVVPAGATPLRTLNPPSRDFTAIPERRRATAAARCLFVETLRAEFGGLVIGDEDLRRAVERLKALDGMPKHLSPSTARRLIRVYKAAPGPLGKGDLLANVPGRPGPKRRRTHGTVALMIDDALSEQWLTPTPDELLATYWQVHAAVDRENALRAQRPDDPTGPLPLRMPSLATFYRIVAEYDDKDRVRKQDGSRAARNSYQPVLATPEERKPMGALEIDHTPIDVIVVDVNGLVLGRPTLTIAVDRCSRMIVGFALHWEGESYAGIMMALRHAIMPKTYLREAFGDAIANDWPCWSLPSTIVIDNGPANHSHNLDAACASLGNIEIDYTESRRPQHKAKVERTFGRLNKILFHQMPGATLKRGRDSDYDPSKLARIQLQHLNRGLHRSIVDFFNVKYHHTLGDTPLAVWTDRVEKVTLRTPAHIDDLDVLSSGSQTRTLSVQGIRLFGLRYNSLAIENLRIRARGDHDVNVRYDPTDITKIQIHDPIQERYVDVPCLDPEVHGLSLWRWNAIRKRRLEKKKQNYRSGIWTTRKAIIDEMTAHAVKPSNRTKGKRHAARMHGAATTPDKLARREPTDLRERPPADRPRARGRGEKPADYRSIPELPPVAVKPAAIVPDLPPVAEKQVAVAAILPIEDVSAKHQNASDESGASQVGSSQDQVRVDAGSDDAFEAYVAKNLFRARR